jgi:tetratricopeptide (TPR) repeat protein
MRPRISGRTLRISAFIVSTISSLLVLVPTLSGADPLQAAMALEKQGKLKEARDLYRSAAKEFRATGDQRGLTEALSEAGYISVSLGDYADATSNAEEAIRLRRSLRDNSKLGNDLNTCDCAQWHTTTL